jgi:hypothetical protein
MKKVILLLGLLTPVIGFAQNYSIDWYKIAGGGGTSTNGQYSLSGTVGQPDAGGAMTGGNYSLTGGYWALYAVQTPGLPHLSIRLISANSVVVSWSSTGAYTLQTNNNLATGGWTGYGGSVSINQGTNSVNLVPPTGHLFFRLQSP